MTAGDNKWNYQKIPIYISYFLGLSCFLLALFFHSLVGSMHSISKTQEKSQKYQGYAEKEKGFADQMNKEQLLKDQKKEVAENNN